MNMFSINLFYRLGSVLVVFWYSTAAFSMCATNRMPFLEMMGSVIAKLEPSLVDSDIIRKSNADKISNATDSIAELPVTVTSSTSYSSNSEDGGIASSSSEAGTFALSATTDLTLWKYLNEREKRKLELQLSELEYDRSSLNLDALTIQTILDISESSSLIDINLSKQELNKKKLRFFEQKLALGESSQNEIYAVKQFLRDLVDQQRSLKVRQYTRLGDIQLVPEQAVLIPNFNLFDQPLRSVSGCSVDQFWSVVESKIKLQISELEMKAISFAKLPSIESTVSSRYSDQSSSTTNKIQFSLTQPLYAGNVISNREKAGARVVEINRSTLEVEKKRAVQEIIKRDSIENIYKASLDTIDSQLVDYRSRLDELVKRRNLGQSVFLELTDAMIETLDLEAQRIRVLSEIYRGWLEYQSQFARPEVIVK